MIAIIDYGMGNLRSVTNAVATLGHEPRVCTTPAEVKGATHIILPGVGSFNRASINLIKADLTNCLHDAYHQGTPMLGICLGMQLLATLGFEHGTSKGLNLIPGQIKRLETRDHRLPHMGWNQEQWAKPHPVLEGIKPHLDLYFVHSYRFIPDSIGDTLGTTEYDGRFTSAVAHNNLIGFQFHPEKSQDAGLKLLENFCLWDGLC